MDIQKARQIHALRGIQPEVIRLPPMYGTPFGPYPQIQDVTFRGGEPQTWSQGAGREPLNTVLPYVNPVIDQMVNDAEARYGDANQQLDDEALPNGLPQGPMGLLQSPQRGRQEGDIQGGGGSDTLMGSGGGYGKGYKQVATKSQVAAYIREQAVARGIDPDYAVRVAQGEGLNVYVGDHGKSFGPFQLYTGGGVGNRFIRDTKLDPSDPNTWREQVQYALNVAAKEGWGQWNGRPGGRSGPRWVGLDGAQAIPLGAPVAPTSGIADVAALNPPTGAEAGMPFPLQGYQPPDAAFASPGQQAISDMLGQPGDPGSSPGQALTADQIDELTRTDVAGNYVNPLTASAQPGTIPLQLPPRWTPATSFPPPPPPRRPGPGGALGVDLGNMPAGMPVPPSRPNNMPMPTPRPGNFDWMGGGAPDVGAVPTPGISPLRPAFGGPGDRRPQPPSRAQGIPLPPMRPVSAASTANMPAMVGMPPSAPPGGGGAFSAPGAPSDLVPFLPPARGPAGPAIAPPPLPGWDQNQSRLQSDALARELGFNRRQMEGYTQPPPSAPSDDLLSGSGGSDFLRGGISIDVRPATSGPQPGDLSVERFYDPTSMTYQPKTPLTTPPRVVGSPEDAYFNSPIPTPGAPPTYIKPSGYSGTPWAYGPLVGDEPIGGPAQATAPTFVPGAGQVIAGPDVGVTAYSEEPPDPTALAWAPPSVTARDPQAVQAQVQPRTATGRYAEARPGFSTGPGTGFGQRLLQSFIPGGSFLGPNAVFGLGNAGSFTPFGTPGAGGTSFFNQQPGGAMGTTNWRQGSVTGNPAMSGVMWNRSGNNGSVGYVTNPFNDSMIYTGSSNRF